MPDTPIPPARLVLDGADLCELALRLPTEAKQNAALAAYLKLLRESEGQL
jgi:hypothetical protein